MDTYRFQVIIEQDEDGFFVADVPALAGCHTQGKTFEEALENIREVIAFPKTATASCLLTGAPADIDQMQWDELGLKPMK